MKSIYLVLNGDSKTAFEMREAKDPAPGDGEVLIKVEASGLNFADVLARLGLYPDAPGKPCVLGYEVVGRVAEVGAGAGALSAGDGCWRSPDLEGTPTLSWPIRPQQ